MATSKRPAVKAKAVKKPAPAKKAKVTKVVVPPPPPPPPGKKSKVAAAVVEAPVTPTPPVPPPITGPRVLRGRHPTHHSYTALEVNRDHKRAFIVTLGLPKHGRPPNSHSYDLIDLSHEEADAQWEPVFTADGSQPYPVARCAAVYLFSEKHSKTRDAYNALEEAYMKHLNDMALEQLITMYNEHAKRPVQTFVSKEAAVSACRLLLEAATKPIDAPTDTTTTNDKENTMATKKTTTKKAAAKKPATAAAKPEARSKVKVAGAGSNGRAPGVGDFIRKAITAHKMTDEEIVKAAKKEFKDSNPNVKNVAWYRSNMRKTLGSNKVPAPVKAKE